jgi:hypothetical protein
MTRTKRLRKLREDKEADEGEKDKTPLATGYAKVWRTEDLNMEQLRKE